MVDKNFIEAFVAISQVKARYCRYLDAQDWEGFASVFTDDFELDVSGSGGASNITGRDEAVTYVRNSLEGAKTSHQVHVPEIELNGEEASVIWAMQDRVIWDKPKNGMQGLTGYGHYRERYVCQDGDWKIAASKLTRLHLDFDKVE